MNLMNNQSHSSLRPDLSNARRHEPHTPLPFPPGLGRLRLSLVPILYSRRDPRQSFRLNSRPRCHRAHLSGVPHVSCSPANGTGTHQAAGARTWAAPSLLRPSPFRTHEYVVVIPPPERSETHALLSAPSSGSRTATVPPRGFSSDLRAPAPAP